MASASETLFKSRKDHRKEFELQEARKAGLAPSEVDHEDGREINPHIPNYISVAPWYINPDQRPSLKHQRKRKSADSPINNCTKLRHGIVSKIARADKYRKGACDNCGAMTHDSKSCVERPRKVGAKWTNKHIAPDEKIETVFELDYDGKRDHWINGYDSSIYAAFVIKQFETRDDLRSDEAKVDESKQMDFAKIDKRARTTSGGRTGTARNLRIREDTAKYLRNLDVNSAYYDPKTRSLREDPLPDEDPNEKLYGGDNQFRNSGQALEFKKLNILYANMEAFDNGQDFHILQAAPSQAELVYKNYTLITEKLKSKKKCMILEKYGDVATEKEIPRELLLGQTEDDSVKL